MMSDWDSKLASIVKETEIHLASVKVGVTIASKLAINLWCNSITQPLDLYSTVEPTSQPQSWRRCGS